MLRSFLLQVFKERTNQPEYFHDFCDGQVYKEHPLFSVDKRALQLIIYTDEVETANPLGSYRGKHKLSKFLSVQACMNVLSLNLSYIWNLCRCLLQRYWQY